MKDYIPPYLNQSLAITWKAGMSFKGNKIFYNNLEDGQIAISHFIVLTVKNIILLYKKSMFVMGSFSIFIHSENVFFLNYLSSPRVPGCMQMVKTYNK